VTSAWDRLLDRSALIGADLPGVEVLVDFQLQIEQRAPTWQAAGR
jgi:hypothetical protein